MKRIIAAALIAASTFLLAPASHATIIAYYATLSGPNESPPNGSPATGLADATYDSVLHTLTINAVFSGLTGTTTASHIHCCTASPFTANAGVATELPSFAGFPLGVTAGSYTDVHNLTLLSNYNPAFVSANGGTAAGAEAALAAGLASGKAYLNIHTSTFGGGEIRGFLVPEPASLAILTAGLLGMGLTKRRRG